MDKIRKILVGIGIVALAMGITIYMTIAITQTPASEGISVLVRDNNVLPVADDCIVYVEYLCMNEDNYNYYQDIVDNPQYLVRCDDDITKINLIIYTHFDGRPRNKHIDLSDGRSINKHMDLPEGGVGIFYNPTDKKEYLIFFERTHCSIKESGEETVAVFLRVRQL